MVTPGSEEALLEGLVDGVLEIDSRWRVRYVNPSACRLFGRPREALIGRELWQELPEFAATPFEAVCRKAMAERSTQSVEGEYARLGTPFEARVLPTPQVGLVIFFRDNARGVRQQREAETLTETRALLDAVMRFSTSLIYAKDLEGRFTLVNSKLEELLGFTPGSLVGKSDHDIFPREIADPFRENDRTVMRERRPLTAEEQILVDGQLRMNLSVKFPLVRPDGTVFGTAGVSTDVTERVRQQQATTLLAEFGLKMSQTLDWDATLSAIVDVVAARFADYCLLDIIGEDGVVRRQAVASRDPSRLSLLRQTLAFSSDLSEDTPLTRVLREGRTERIADVDEAWRKGIARSLRHLAIIEELGPRSALIVPLIAHGRPLGMLEIVSTGRRFDARDQETAEELGRLCALALDNARLFAEGKRREDALREVTEQLRDESSLRDLFMAVLAHDLRNPLNAIRIGAQTLARREELPEAAVRGAQRIISSVERMGNLIEQVLDLTRARAMGGIPFERRPMRLDALVSAVVEEIRAAYPTCAIDVVMSGDCSGNWDPDRLAQMASNLVGNAVTHSTPGTPVRVEVKGDENVVLTVHNESAPIPPELLKTLFDPFRRGTASSSGLGLGLYISDQIVRAHGGSIDVESDASGTLFRVTLSR